MTMGGAFSELNNLLKADDIPFYYKPSIKAVMDTITLSSSENPNKWIPCSERLPEEDGDYLVTTKWIGSYSGDVYIETHVAYYRKKPKEWDCVDIIAWMPLPEPYKEGEE